MGKRTIRRKCFETNSSSMHSICITKNDTHVTKDELAKYDVNPDECLYMDKGKIWIDDMSEGFGRYPFMILTTFKDKLRYAICEYLGHIYPDEPEWNETTNMFDALIKEVTGATEVEFSRDVEFNIYTDADDNEIPHRELVFDHYDEDWREVYKYKGDDGELHPTYLSDEYYNVPKIGTIDHQSAGMLKNFLKDWHITLKEFLTNKKYIIIVDGDEYCEFDNLMRSGLIDKSFILNFYNKSGEDAEYQEWLKEQEYEENYKTKGA